MPTGVYVIYNYIESNHNNMFIFIIWVQVPRLFIIYCQSANDSTQIQLSYIINKSPSSRI